MTMDIHDIENANLGTTMGIADRWRRGGDDLRSTAGDLRSTAKLPDWDGSAAKAMRHRLDSSTNRTDVAGVRGTAVGLVTGVHTTALMAAQGIVRTVLAAARSTGMRIDPDGTVRPGGGGTVGKINGILSAVPGPVGGFVDGSAAAMTAALKEAIATVLRQDALAGGYVSATCDIDRPPSVAPVEFSPGTVTELTGDPGKAAAAGTVVFPASLDGVLDDGERQELTGSVERARESLALRGIDPDEVGVAVMDLAGSPAVVVGDITTADKVSTLVSGVGSSGSGATAGTAAAAGRIAGPGHAVVAWHGYNAPGNVVIGALPAHAQVGATALRNAQKQLRETTREDVELQVIAHSYGTTLTGTAATQPGEGLEADTVQFLGSPGVRVESAGELDLHATDGRAEVHVWTEPGDFIGLATNPLDGVHGRDPASLLFGADSVDGVSRGSDGTLSLSDELLSGGWDAVTDVYLWLRGDWNTHSAYLSDEQVLEKLR